MVNDRVLLQLFLQSRQVYEQYHSYVRLSALTEEAKLILEDIGKYYVSYPNKVEINIPEFTHWFLQVQHPELNDSQVHLFSILFETLASTLQEKLSEEYVTSVLSHFQQEDFKERLKKHLDTPEGWEPATVISLVEQFEKSKETATKGPDWVPNDLLRSLQVTDRQNGLSWRLTCLNRSIGSLIPGDFAIIGAPVEVGKTAFCVSEVVWMAGQLRGNDCILWFHNEGKEEKTINRLHSCAASMNEDEMRADPEEAQRRYLAWMHGDVDRIRLYNAPNWTPNQIRAKCRKYKPRLVLIDMLDKLRMPGKGAAEEHLRVSALYLQIRLIANEFCPVLGTTQCNATTVYRSKSGEDTYQRYIRMDQMRQSGVDKQAEGEIVIMIGHDPTYPETRYINVCKNKSGKKEARYTKCEVLFNEEFSLYQDALRGNTVFGGEASGV